MSPVNVIVEENLKKKLSTNDTRTFTLEASMCGLMPPGDNQIATKIRSQKCKIEIVRESYASVTRRSKEVHKSIQKKDDKHETSMRQC